MAIKIEVDMCTHTNNTQWGFSTLLELVSRGKQRGVNGIAYTEYGPGMIGTPTADFYTTAMKNIPKNILGAQIYRGIELNVLSPNKNNYDFAGEEEKILYLDWIVAKYRPKFKEGQADSTVLTNMYLNLLTSPAIMSIGELNLNICDYDAVIKACRDALRPIELCEATLTDDKSTRAAKQIIEVCKKYKAPIVVGSGAHIATQVGDYKKLLSLLEEYNFPESLILNSKKGNIDTFIAGHKRRFAQNQEKSKIITSIIR